MRKMLIPLEFNLLKTSSIMIGDVVGAEVAEAVVVVVAEVTTIVDEVTMEPIQVIVAIIKVTIVEVVVVASIVEAIIHGTGVAVKAHILEEAAIIPTTEEVEEVIAIITEVVTSLTIEAEGTTLGIEEGTTPITEEVVVVAMAPIIEEAGATTPTTEVVTTTRSVAIGEVATRIRTQPPPETPQLI